MPIAWTIPFAQPIAPYNETSNYGIVRDRYMRWWHRAVATEADMFAIPVWRREFGMLVTVYNDPDANKNQLYVLANVALNGTDNDLSNNANFTRFKDNPNFQAWGIYPLQLFVDANNWDDATAVREDIVRPYQTIQAAVDAAFPWDTIVIRGGTYNEERIQKDWLTYFIDYWSKIETNARPIFDDTVEPWPVRINIINNWVIRSINGDGNSDTWALNGNKDGSVYNIQQSKWAILDSTWIYWNSSTWTWLLVRIVWWELTWYNMIYAWWRLFCENVNIVNAFVGTLFAPTYARVFLKWCNVFRNAVLVWSRSQAQDNNWFVSNSWLTLYGGWFWFPFNTPWDNSAFTLQNCYIDVRFTTTSNRGTIIFNSTTSTWSTYNFSGNSIYDVNTDWVSTFNLRDIWWDVPQLYAINGNTMNSWLSAWIEDVYVWSNTIDPAFIPTDLQQ